MMSNDSSQRVTHNTSNIINMNLSRQKTAEIINQTNSKIITYPSSASIQLLDSTPRKPISTPYELDRPVEPSNKFMGNAFEYIEVFDASRKLLDKTKRILQLLQQETQPYQDLDMPLIGVSTPEDDEILIGWSVSHVRIGFSIVGEGDESSWYAVTDETIDATNAAGYLSDFESEEKLVAFLVSYVIGTYRKYNR